MPMCWIRTDFARAFVGCIKSSSLLLHLLDTYNPFLLALSWGNKDWPRCRAIMGVFNIEAPQPIHTLRPCTAVSWPGIPSKLEAATTVCTARPVDQHKPCAHHEQHVCQCAANATTKKGSRKNTVVMLHTKLTPA